MFDWLKSKLSKVRTGDSRNYKKLYSNVQKILDEPVEYARTNTNFSSPEEVKKLFQDRNLAKPEDWTAEEIYYLTKKNSKDKLPNKNPQEIKDVAVKISLTAAEFSVAFSMADGTGNEISQAIIAIYDHHPDYNTWPSAVKFTLFNSAEAEEFLKEHYREGRDI
jgi:hypothetical protein